MPDLGVQEVEILVQRRRPGPTQGSAPPRGIGRCVGALWGTERIGNSSTAGGIPVLPCPSVGDRPSPRHRCLEGTAATGAPDANQTHRDDDGHAATRARCAAGIRGSPLRRMCSMRVEIAIPDPDRDDYGVDVVADGSTPSSLSCRPYQSDVRRAALGRRGPGGWHALQRASRTPPRSRTDTLHAGRGQSVGRRRVRRSSWAVWPRTTTTRRTPAETTADSAPSGAAPAASRVPDRRGVARVAARSSRQARPRARDARPRATATAPRGAMPNTVTARDSSAAGRASAVSRPRGLAGHAVPVGR